ncbi:MAG: hypothetical protein ABI780_00895 [Ardenticatenales bacterium]
MHEALDAAPTDRRTMGGASAQRRAALARRALAAAAVLLATLTLPAWTAFSAGPSQRPTAADAASQTVRTASSNVHRPAAYRTRVADARRRSAVERDQAPARAPITVTVGGLSARWRTLPNTVVTATLRGRDGVKAQGGGQSDSNGRVMLQIFPTREGARIAAGDALFFKADGLDDVWSVSIPPLDVDVDATNDRVIGHAAPGSDAILLVRLQIADALDFFGSSIAAQRAPSGVPVPPSLERRDTAGPDGSLAFDLAGDATLAPGDAVALVQTDPAGDAFVAIGAVTQALVRTGQAWGIAFATLGTTVTLDVIRPDGTTRLTLQGVAAEVDGDATTSMAYLNPPGSDGGEDGDGMGGDHVDGAPNARLGGGGGGDGDTGGPPEVGDRLVLRRDGGLLAPPAVTATLPTLAVDGMDRGGGVSGRAPAGAPLAARLHSPFGERYDLDVTPGPDDMFEAHVATPLGPGWRAVLVWSDPSGIAAGVVGAVPQVRARVGSPRLNGIGIPGRIVTATLRDGRGTALGTYTDTIGEGGDFAITLAHVAPGGQDLAVQRLMPGTSVVVSFDDGDPVVVPITDVSTFTDADRETVAGLAPPGSDVVVTLERPTFVDTDGEGYGYAVDDHRGVKAGLDGRWAIDYGAAGAPGGPIDIEPPLWGEAVLVRPDGHFVTRPWAPLSIRAELAGSGLSGFGPPGEAVDVTLRDPDGAVVVQHRSDERELWGDDQPFWYTDIVDRFEQSVPAAADDHIEVTMAGQTAVLDLPAVEAVSHVAEDLVTGRTLPDAPIDLEYWTPSGASDRITGTSSLDGAFAFDLAARHVDLEYNAAVGLTVHVGRHRVHARVNIPGLTIDLDSGDVFGSAEPDVEATLSVERGGRPVGRQPIRTDAYGWFDAGVRGADGTPIVPRPGDVIVLSTPRARFIEPRVAMVVPELTVDLPPSRDHAAGTYDALGTLAVDLWSDGPTGQWPDETDLQTGADGRWNLAWTNPQFSLIGGWTVWSQWTAPSGHQAFRERAVPRLDVRLGSPAACGRALPARPVRMTLQGRDGAGSSATTSRPNGAFHGSFATADGRPVAVRAGDRVTADLGGWDADFVVPPLDLTVDWAGRRITGTTAASATLAIAQWLGDCTDDDGGLGWNRWGGVADASGRFEAPIPDDLGVFDGDGRFAVVVTTSDGHRTYAPLGSVNITAMADTPNASGSGMPSAPFTATLLGSDRRQRAMAAGTVGTDGRWSLALADASGRAVNPRDGDVLRVGAAGSVGTLPIETLGFDFDVRRGLLGAARPKRHVAVTFGLAAKGLPDGDERWYDMVADDRGAFAIDAPPPRGRWTFADVRSIRATVFVTGGHRIESRAVFAAPAPAPVYLPIGHKR